MNNWFSKHLVFPIMLRLYGENALEILKELEKSQWLPHEKIADLQLEKLKYIFCHSYEKIPYYRRVLREYGLNPYHIRSLGDIEKYPILKKEDVKENFADLIITPKAKRFEERYTSGTTGLAFGFIKDRVATSHMRAIDFRAYGWHGIDVGSKQGRFWSSEIKQEGVYRQRIKDFILNRRRYSVMNISDTEFHKYYEHMKKFRPTYVYGYASAIFEFSNFMLREKLQSIKSVKTVITTSEMLFPNQRACIEDAFKCGCVNEYGCTEVGIVAFECPENNLHLMEDNLYIEFAKGGKRAQPRENGDILVTELNNFSMPFLRYDLGDVGSYSTERCRCGRGLALMQSMDGRRNSFFRTTDGRIVYDNIFDFMVKSPHVKLFKVILLSDTKILVRIVPQNDRIPEEIIEEFTKVIRRYVGDNMAIEYEMVGIIERETSGKRNYFQSLV